MATSLSEYDWRTRLPPVKVFEIKELEPLWKMFRSPLLPNLAWTLSLNVRLPELLTSVASLRRKELESIPSRVAASTAVSEAPEPLNEVAVTIPETLRLPVPVISLLFRSRLPPSCGVVSSTTLEIPPPPPPPEDANVILSPLAFVVIVILLPATRVKVSVALSATTSL